MKRHVLVSAVAGIVVASLSLACTWQHVGAFIRNPELYPAIEVSGLVHIEVERYRKDQGRYPSALKTLNLSASKYRPNDLQFDSDGVPLDFWGTPFVYSLEGDSYQLTTLGADRSPGGSGSDADVSLERLGDESGFVFPPPTFWQFVVRYATPAMFITAAIAGVCTFFVGYSQTRAFGGSPGSMATYLFSVVGVGVMSAIVAGILAVWHLPFEHH